MPSPLEPAIDYGSGLCSRCQDTIRCWRDDYYRCEQKGCEHDFLCIGCVYECAECGRDFCWEHIFEIPQGDGWARYECVNCHQPHIVRMPSLGSVEVQREAA